MFNENKIKYCLGDIRFTSKGDNTFYAYFLGWPANGKLTIRSLSKGVNPAGPLDKNIASLTLLGSDDKIAYTQDANGLHVILPPSPPAKGACALKLVLE